MTKHFLGIIVLGLLWCNVGFADNIYDLKIPIEKAKVETKIIKPNKEYSQSCVANTEIERTKLKVIIDSYVEGVGKKQNLVEEINFNLGKHGQLIVKSKQKIKSDGALSKVKASSDYIPGSIEYSKKEINEVKKIFKMLAKYFSERAINYGEKLTLGIKREDAKKKMLKIFKDFEGSFLAAGEDPKEVKEFMKILKKDSRFETIKEYLGTTELNGEKFYAVRWDGTFEYVGNIPEMKEALEETSYNSVYFIHAPSGYKSAAQITMEEIDPSTEMYEDMICTIYKNDQMLTEVSISALEDKAVTKKTETKETKKKVVKKKKEVTQTDSNNNITQQLKALNELYKSGALTKEEFEKAKKKLLN